MIEIDEQLLVGRGRDRACYQHPGNPDRCIKLSIVKNDKQSHREPAYYRKLQARNIPWRNIARYYGDVQTDRGKGQEFELVRDYDGQVSQSISRYLDQGTVGQDAVVVMLNEIKTLIFTHAIFTRDISPNNLLYKKESAQSGRLVMIDGLGNAELIPVSEWFSPLTRKRIAKKWRGLIRRLASTYPAYHFEEADYLPG